MRILWISLALAVGGLAAVVTLVVFDEPQVEYPDDDNPYSVYTARFRRASDAERAAERLRRKLDQPSFVIKVGEKEGAAWYEAHLGPWPATQPAETASRAAQEAGVAAPRIENYESYREELDASAMATAVEAERPLEPKVLDPEEGPDLDPPASIPVSVADLTERFPLNRDLAIIDMGIYSVEPGRELDLDDEAGFVVDGFYFPSFVTERYLQEHSDGVVAVKFEDNLFPRRFSFLVASAATSPGESLETAGARLRDSLIENTRRVFEAADYELEVMPSDLDIAGRPVAGRWIVARKEGKTTITFLVGLERGSNVVYFARSLYEAPPYITQALDNRARRVGLGGYGEVVRTLYTLPDQRERFRLIAFRLEQVDQEYVDSKGDAEWARGMRGYWSAIAVFADLASGEMSMLQVFDLRKGSYARWIYDGLYGESKREILAKAESNPYLKQIFQEVLPEQVAVEGRSGWFVPTGPEISFASSRYIVALSREGAGPRELVDVAKDLRVFVGRETAEAE